MVINAPILVIIPSDNPKGGKCYKTQDWTDKKVRVPRRDDYEKRPVLSATIHPDLKRTLVAMSERTGMSLSQVADEVLYAGLVEMQELWGGGVERTGPAHRYIK